MTLFSASQSSLLQPQLGFRVHSKINATSVTGWRLPLILGGGFASSSSDYKSTVILGLRTGLSKGVAAIVSDSKQSSDIVIESSAGEEASDIQPSTIDGDDGTGGGGGGEGGGGGGGGGDNNNNEGEGKSDEDNRKKMAMSMSQKLTLGYAALVGLGGVMGYLKSGSQKSLLAGGLSASLLYFVYTQLPVRPAFASSIGLGLSAALLGIMGSRFKNSGKIFPAGVVSLVSLVMTGGYLHGILRSMH